MKIIFIFSCSGMFRGVPECSGMFRNVPACSGMFRNVPCSGFYRRPKRQAPKLFLRSQSRKWITVKPHGKHLQEVAGCVSKAWKPPSSRPIWIYFEFRGKPSLITVISIDPRPTNYLRQNIVFSYPEMIRVSFSLSLSLSVFCYFTFLLIFI